MTTAYNCSRSAMRPARKRDIFLREQHVKPWRRFLDSPIAHQYGPRGFEAAELCEALKSARVEGMADGPPDEDPRKELPRDEAALSARLQRLGERLATVSRTSEHRTSPRQGADSSAFARGFRLSTELVAGVLVGAGLGWLIDRWLGTTPLALILLLLLGFAAGVLNVMRAAGVAPERNLKD